MHAFPIYDWVVSIFVGSVVVSYWRCTWVLMDLWLCDQPEDASLAQGNSFCLLVDATLDPEVAALRVQSACISYGIGVGCLAVGVTIIWMGWWVPQNDKQRVTPLVAIVRFVAIYFLGFSGVNIWRGIWYLADDWILPTQPYASYWTTSIAGSSLCFLLWGGNSLLAPPSIFLLDGPGLASPPVAVTLLSSHFAVSLPVDQEPPQLSLPTMMADVLISFLLLPFGVVWYWRGSWLLLDYWFWGLTDSDDDVNMSLLWTFVLAVLAGFVTSEPVFGSVDSRIESHLVLCMLGRLRTYIMAWGTVSFWRLIWYIWDQFLGATQLRWAIMGHVLAIVVLTTIGCVSSICAPSSTLGVDSVPDENAADEPLFAMLPLPHELLYLFGIARQPVSTAKEREEEIEMGSVLEESERTAAIESKRKKMPARESDLVDISEDFPAVAHLAPEPWESQMEASGTLVPTKRIEEKGEEQGRVPALSTNGSTRGWQTEGGFRSYLQLQRFGSVRIKSESAQRPGLENKRSRSKFFRSR